MSKSKILKKLLKGLTLMTIIEHNWHWILSNHSDTAWFYTWMCQYISKKVLLARPQFETKFSSCSRVFVQGEWQKYTCTLMIKDQETLDIK